MYKPYSYNQLLKVIGENQQRFTRIMAAKCPKCIELEDFIQEVMLYMWRRQPLTIITLEDGKEVDELDAVRRLLLFNAKRTAGTLIRKDRVMRHIPKSHTVSIQNEAVDGAAFGASFEDILEGDDELKIHSAVDCAILTSFIPKLPTKKQKYLRAYLACDCDCMATAKALNCSHQAVSLQMADIKQLLRGLLRSNYV